jgi:hypothetical protein
VGLCPTTPPAFKKAGPKLYFRKANAFRGLATILGLMPGEADRKVFAKPFSKGLWGMGQRPMLLQRVFFWKLETFFYDRKKGFKNTNNHSTIQGR